MADRLTVHWDRSRPVCRDRAAGVRIRRCAQPLPADPAILTEERIAEARKAAEQVFDGKSPTFEPNTVNEARAAVEGLQELFDKLAGSVKQALEGARSGGSLLSSDRLQGLSEVVQNADDCKATEVCFLTGPTELMVRHNGNPVRLADVLGMAMPWLSTKADDAGAIGRFGIGLTALQSLSTTLEVHCEPYHFRIGDPTIAPIEPPAPPSWTDQPDQTGLRIPLHAGSLNPAHLEEWLNNWGDSALLFLNHVERVTLVNADGGEIHKLHISRHRDEHEQLPSRHEDTSRELAISGDGQRSWAVYRSEVPKPEGVERANKKTGDATPIAVAVPLDHSDTGRVYAGLPVTETRAPVFVNAHFDPVTGRSDLADTPWNRRLVELVAQVWSAAVLDCFERDPRSTWEAIPIPRANEAEAPASFVHGIEAALIEQARNAVASQLSFPVPAKGNVALPQLAVEVPQLEGLLEDKEIADLAGLRATLPHGVRDQAGWWRYVLDDWRKHSSGLPDPVGVELALGLLENETRTVESTIALIAVALEEDLGHRLRKLRCVIAHDGQRSPPPDKNSIPVFSVGASALGESLGITTLLHPAYSADTDGATAVLDWLRGQGAVIEGSDDSAVVRSLAKAGNTDHCIESPLSDEQLCALRDAFETIPQAEQKELGCSVGRAVRLESFRYDSKSQGKIKGAARPVDAYLPRAIDSGSDSFAVAAHETPEIAWLSAHYAKSLRSEAGREGLGSMRFLRLLGAETAPRVQPHRDLQRRFPSKDQLGLHIDVRGSPETRNSAMRERKANYTLDDLESPDLIAVLQDISRVRAAKKRRERAEAVLATLGRAWDGRLKQHSRVEAAWDRVNWKTRGSTTAFWLERAADVAWLDDESGKPRKPSELRVRTTVTEAIYGSTSKDYVHKNLGEQRREVLFALRVSSDPSRSELMERLRDIRETAGPEGSTSRGPSREDALVVYRALAKGLNATRIDSDLTPEQLCEAFKDHRLVLTNPGWRPPESVFKGPAIFGHLRPFAPADSKCEPLWDVLQLRTPSANDCIEVLREIANRRKDPPDQTLEPILLESLRQLASGYKQSKETDQQELANELARLALWTTKGWARKRPVYATDDQSLTDGLREHLPIWQPGGTLDQFRPLLEPLRVTELRADEARVIKPETAVELSRSTEIFRASIPILRDDLNRNESSLAKKLRVPWDSLSECIVKELPSLSLTINVAEREYEYPVTATVDTNSATVFVRERSALPRADGVGRALASLFIKGDQRGVSHAWGAACEQAEEGMTTQPIELAEERAAKEQAETDSRLTDIDNRIERKHRSRQPSQSAKAPKARRTLPATDKNPAKGSPSPMPASRTLVDPQSLELVNPKGARPEDPDNPPKRKPTAARALKSPAKTSNKPENRSGLRAYSDLDREDVGMEIFKTLLRAGEDDLTDLRTQRGVGADAVDELGNYYELKVFAGPEPDQVTLTDSEVQRAVSTPQFFLVVVSNVERQQGAQTTVRIVVNPLQELHPTDRGKITLAGLHNAKSLTYQFESVEGGTPSSDPDNEGSTASLDRYGGAGGPLLVDLSDKSAVAETLDADGIR